MNDATVNDQVRPGPTAQRVDAVCDRFEADWRAGRAPRIEDYLAEASGAERPALLRELLPLELELRRGDGAGADLSDYLTRFADHPEAVALAFGAALTLTPGPSPRVSSDTEADPTLDHAPDGRSTQTDRAAGDGPGAGPRGAGGASGRFRNLRPLARGGLGEVFVADDTELNREVALKRIQSDHAHDPASRARFLLEAEITGRLEHPGVVPVYSLGFGPDGSPFYAMRLIRDEGLKGTTLKAAIDEFHQADRDPRRDPGERRLALRGLLGRFVAVCDAVAYAHDRGVLHRDIKPANILLGPYGETLVVDWGLAKVVGRGEGAPASSEATLRPAAGSDSAETQAGSQVGTPGYMSPEQAWGRVDDLTRASDVFSLGATLYALLTGRSPYPSRDKHEALDAARACRFPRPREVAPWVPLGLEAVCLKAMAREPVDRYATARALGEDVTHWLADEPVSALPEGPVRRAGRWLRRHRGVTAAAVLALAAVAVVSLVAWGAVSASLAGEKAARALAVKSMGDAQKAGRRAEAERDAAKAARDEADRRRREADAARDEAEAMLGLTLSAHDDLRKVADEILARIPGMDGERLKLGQKNLENHRTLIRERARRGRPVLPELRVRTARAARLVGNLNRGIGLYQHAGSFYREAIAHLAGLPADSRREPGHRAALAEIELDAADTLRASGRPSGGEAHCKASLELADGLRVEFPGEPNYLRIKAWGVFTLAGVHAASGRTEEAVAGFERAADLLVPVAQGEKKSLLDDLILAMIQGERGEALRDGGRRPEAESALRGAVGRIDGLPKAVQDANDVRFIRTKFLVAQAEILADAPGRRDDALGALDKAVAEMERLVREFPGLVNYRRALAEALDARGALRGDRADLERARVTLQGLTAGPEPVPAFEGLLGRVLGHLGRLARDPDEARSLLEEALVRQQKALDANPGSLPDLAARARHRAALKALDGPAPAAAGGRP